MGVTARVSLPDEAVTCDVTNQLGCVVNDKGQYEEAKVIWLAALEGRRRVLGKEHKDTLMSLNNIGVLLKNMKDYKGALDYNQQSLRVQEKALGKAHPNTLMTITNMAIVHKKTENFTKAEELYRVALDG